MKIEPRLFVSACLLKQIVDSKLARFADTPGQKGFTPNAILELLFSFQHEDPRTFGSQSATQARPSKTATNRHDIVFAGRHETSSRYVIPGRGGSVSVLNLPNSDNSVPSEFPSLDKEGWTRP